MAKSDICLALAGVLMAAQQVKQLAASGQVDPEVFSTLIQSLLVTNPKNAEEVVGSVAATKTGLAILIAQLEQPNKDPELIKYVIGMLALERRLSSDSRMLTEISQRIERLRQQVQHYGLLHDNVLASLAGTYSDTISTFKFRIQVSGQPRYLEVKENQHRVRALLLTGIRMAILWRQVGGRRLQIIFRRSQLLACARQLYQQC